jgi:hypothetical protein
MTKIGLFVNGELVVEYPFGPEFFTESLTEAAYLTTESGIFHEVKIFEDETNG